MNLERALQNSHYDEYQKECIRRTFESAGIDTLKKLDNAPRTVGHICGNIDIYQLVAHIRAWSLDEEV